MRILIGIVLGIMLLVAGVLLLVFGYQKAESLKEEAETVGGLIRQLIERSPPDNTATWMYVGGAVLCVGGAALCVAGVFQIYSGKK